MTLADGSVSRDVLALAADQRVAAVQLFQMRAGKFGGPAGVQPPTPASPPPARSCQRVLEEHYSQVEPVEIPPEVLVQHQLPRQELVEDWLSERRGHKVRLLQPRRQQKAELIELVETQRRLRSWPAPQRTAEQHALATEDLAQLLDLPEPPRRIEVSTSSHIQGSDAVASQVVFVDGLPAKQHYRKYRIQSSSITGRPLRRLHGDG